MYLVLKSRAIAVQWRKGYRIDRNIRLNDKSGIAGLALTEGRHTLLEETKVSGRMLMLDKNNRGSIVLERQY